MRLDWKRLGWSLVCTVLILLAIRLYFCKYSLSYGLCILENMLRYFFTYKVFTLVLLTAAIYVIWPFFSRKSKEAERAKFNDEPILKEKETFHYSITSFALLIVVNFLVITGLLYNAHARKGYYVGTEGLGFMVWAFILLISFIIVYVSSIVKTVKIRGTNYGKKSIKIIAATTIILVIDIVVGIIKSTV